MSGGMGSISFPDSLNNSIKEGEITEARGQSSDMLKPAGGLT